ncbi:MAG: hypothetical protein JWR88_35, partial [Pseudonocardia sp.]|nr:hypothetical protein [Pseudonocardia sp.]
MRLARMGLMNTAGVRMVSALLVVACVGACTTTGVVPPSPPVSSARAGTTAPAMVTPDDWPTYHHDNARSGLAPQLPLLGTLKRAWEAPL